MLIGLPLNLVGLNTGSGWVSNQPTPVKKKKNTVSSQIFSVLNIDSTRVTDAKSARFHFQFSSQNNVC